MLSRELEVTLNFAFKEATSLRIPRAQRADLIFGNVRQQRDKSSSQHGNANGTVPFSTGSGTSARENAAVTVDERLQRPQVFVVDINRSRSLFRAVRAEAAAQLLLQTGLLLTSLTNFSSADSTHVTYLECVLIWWEKSASIYINWPQISPRNSRARASAKIAQIAKRDYGGGSTIFQPKLTALHSAGCEDVRSLIATKVASSASHLLDMR